MLILEAHDISWKGRDDFRLEGLNIRIHAGERWGIAGMAGSGKTSFTKILAGIAHTDTGWVRFFGEQLEDPRELLIPGHAGIAYLSQFFELPRNYFVNELINYDNKLSAEETAELSRRCKLEHLINRKSQELSGGEKQRLALARLLVRKPRLLILDEPFSNLDLIHRSLLKEVLDALEREDHLTIMIVAHDPMDLLPWADKIMLMHQGTCLQTGAPHEVYTQPVNEIAAGLLGSFNKLSGAAWMRLIEGIQPMQHDRNYMARPADLLAVPHKDGRLTVIDSRFFGTHWQVLVELNELRAWTFSFNRLMNGELVDIEVRTPPFVALRNE